MSAARAFTHAGATLVAERSGGSGGGRTIHLLIHGVGMGRSVFADLVSHLDDDAEVISIDLPGYGEAPEPPRTLTMERTADLVAAYLDAEVRAPVVLVGHSMGAQVAIEVAARHPHTVARLVLVGPSGDPAARTPLSQMSRLMRDLAIESPKVIVLGAREYLRAGPNLRRKFFAMRVHRPETSLPRISAPTLVIRGEEDVVAPRAWCERIVEAIGDARLAEVAGHGHETMIRDAAPAARLIGEFARRG